jgi:hypothetical protein
VSGLTQRDGATLLATSTARGEIFVYECSMSIE